MASQTTHVILSELVYGTHFSHLDERDFIVGTLFPDIRYLKVIERSATHIEGVSLADVKEEPNAFLAGMKFHNLVDQIREEFMVSRNMYEFCPEFKYVTQSVKLLEDERYYAMLGDWPHIISYLDGLIEEEAGYGIPAMSLEKWHGLLREYFMHPPTDHSRERFLCGLDFPTETARSMNAYVDGRRNDARVVRIIDEFIRAFPELLTRAVSHYE